MQMTLETILAIGSFAISFGGLVGILIVRDKTKEISIVVVIAALVILSSIALCQDYQHRQRVATVSKAIMEELGQEVKAFDQLYETLYYVEFTIVNEALNELVNTGKVGHKVLELRDDLGARFRVRGYYVK